MMIFGNTEKTASRQQLISKKMTGPHPESLDDGWIKDAVDAVKEIFSKGVTLVRSVQHKYLLIKDGSASIVDYDELPDDKKDEYRFKDKQEKLSRGGSEALQSSRYDTYRGQSASKIADRASDDPYILGDLLDDPGLVDAGSESEAVAKVAEHNPGWAKISDAVEAHGLDVDADGNVSDSGGDGESAGGGSGDSGGESVAEAASDAASYGGDVSTADAGDLGPTGPSGYGMDAGGSSGGSGGDGGTSMGGDAGGGDVGGGDL